MSNFIQHYESKQKFYKKQRKILYDLLSNEETRQFIIETGLISCSIVKELVDNPLFYKGMEKDRKNIKIQKGKVTITFE